MAKLLSALFVLFASWAAFAQTKTPAEAPVEQASATTVVIFLVLFVGSCVGFIAYTWWRGRQKKATAGD